MNKTILAGLAAIAATAGCATMPLYFRREYIGTTSDGVIMTAIIRSDAEKLSLQLTAFSNCCNYSTERITFERAEDKEGICLYENINIEHPHDDENLRDDTCDGTVDYADYKLDAAVVNYSNYEGRARMTGENFDSWLDSVFETAKSKVNAAVNIEEEISQWQIRRWL